MTLLVPYGPGLGRSGFRPGAGPPPEEPIDPDDPILTIIDSITDIDDDGNPIAKPRVHFRLNETSPNTSLTNRGWLGGTGTLSNPAEVKYRLGSLISGSNNAGRSMAFSGSLSAPPILQFSDLVTRQSFTIEMALQLDRLPASGSKFIPVTQGLSGSVAGATSPIEITSDGRVRSWVSLGSGALVFTTAAGVIPAATGTKVAYRQVQGVGRFIYVNGVLASGGFNDQVTNFTAPPLGPWYFFAWPDGVSPYDGIAGELIAVNSALAVNLIETLGARRQDVLELTDPAPQTFDTSSSGTFDPVSLGLSNPDSEWEIEIVNAGLNSSLTTFELIGPANTTIAWETSSTPGSANPQIRLVDGSTVSATRTLSLTIEGAEAPPAFTCGPASPSVNLGSADNKETTTNLTTGGAACYDATGLISRLRWLGAQGCSSPNRHSTTEQFLYRWSGAHNGGRLLGPSWYSNLTRHEDYDPGGDPGNFSLYPCSDQGGLYIRASSLINFTIIGARAHGAWDPFRMARGGSEVQTGTRIEGSWLTCIRDDVCENDSYIDGAVFTDNLIGDTIGTGPTQSGCFRFYSLAGAETDHTAKRVTISNNLVWASQMRATGRARGIGGYAVGDFFKFKVPYCPRVNLTNNVFMADALCFGGGGGDPLWGIKANSSAALNSSSGNILIWRDLGNAGTYQSLFGNLPPGFTLLTGSEGTSEWDARVAAWKAAHPNVRRFNKTGIARPFSGTFNLVDTG